MLHYLSSLTTKHLSSFILPHISPTTINRLTYLMLSHVWPHTHTHTTSSHSHSTFIAHSISPRYLTPNPSQLTRYCMH